jgi:2,3-bisphosphoglycerate-dependent phosphoglycerate mutase
MKRIVLVLTLVFCGLGVHAQQEKITTVILVRHAEKALESTPDPNLSAEGEARAKKLAAVLKDTKIDAVYSTNYKRTKNTVAPAATARGLELQVYEPLKAETMEEILRKNTGGTILIAGHSNTVPWTANLLLKSETFKNFEDSAYDNLIIVTVSADGSKAIWLHY